MTLVTDAITPDLPSRVEETLAICPQFRIVLIGNSGVGKSSLVSSIFNISLNDIDIAHDRPGRAIIDHEYTSDENPRFVLHDSQGFEAGSTGNWDRVEKFLRERSERELQDRVHTIWLCIPAPLEGSRLQQTGDEKLLSLAQELHIPVIIVFTKCDELLKEQCINAENHGRKLSENDLMQNAEMCFNNRIEKFKESKQVPIVKVSTDEGYSQRLETLKELTNVTYKSLGGIEEGASVPWATTQRINGHQKIEVSISEGFKKYWRDLGSSVFFQGQPMNRCIWRIHDDILQVWNFNDPDKLLFQEDFFKEMLQLVNRVLDGHEPEVQEDNLLGKCTGAMFTAAAAIASSAPHMVVAAAIAEIGILAVRFLYGKYQTMPLHARYLGVYIVDLTCILHRLLIETLRTEPARVLSKELISMVVEEYRKADSWRVQKLVFEMNVMVGFEKKIKDQILKFTTSNTDNNLPQSTAGHETPSGSVPDTSKRSKRPQKSKKSPGDKEQGAKEQDKDSQCILA